MRDYILNHEGSTGQKLGFDQIVRLANQHFNELVAEGAVSIQPEPEIITISQVKTNPRDVAWSEVIKQYTPRQAPVTNQTSASQEVTNNKNNTYNNNYKNNNNSNYYKNHNAYYNKNYKGNNNAFHQNPN